MSQAPCIRSEAWPSTGWITEELTVSAERSAVALGVGEPAVRDQKREERGNGALAEVARHVPGGDRRERAPVSGRPGECGTVRHVAPR
jgi:hypothetical protein